MKSIPKARRDALTDGIFAFAMTLLVIDIRVPLDTAYRSAAELLRALAGLGPELLAYLISFFVLALFWRGLAAQESEADPGSAHILAWLVYLLAMTFIPFSTSLVGAHETLAPAVWIYAANMMGGALASFAMMLTWPGEARLHKHAAIRLSLLMVSVVASVGVSLVHPPSAMWPYLINIAGPAVVTLWERRKPRVR
jgi:uncharacterized membrane protein